MRHEKRLMHDILKPMAWRSTALFVLPAEASARRPALSQ
jgi:hypothetical protein